MTTWCLLLTIILWAGLDFRDNADHPARWWRWLAPWLYLAWVIYLHWKGY